MERNLLPDKWRQDPRYQESLKSLLGMIAESQSSITGARPPDPARQADSRDLVRRTGNLRGGSLFYPYVASGTGKGPLVELVDGSVKYDFITGIGVHYFGHAHPLLIEAALAAALEDTVMQGNLQQNTASVDVMGLFVQAAGRFGAALNHCFLTTSGAMANENALKMVFQKHAPAGRLLAFEKCFAGRTLAMAQVTDKPGNREGLPSTIKVDYVPFYDARFPEESTRRAVATLRRHLQNYPGAHAGMMFELIQGEGGYYPGTREFFVALMTVLKEAELAVIIDEIQTFARTTEMFAFQHFSLDAYVDVVTVGKMTQVCATLFGDAYRPRPGLVSQTFTAATAAIYAARAILNALFQGDLFGSEGRIQRLHTCFVTHLQALHEKYPKKISGPYGCGAMVAMTVFEGDGELSRAFLNRLFANGLMAFIAGENPARIRFLIPVPVVEEEHIEQVVGIIAQTLQEFDD